MGNTTRQIRRNRKRQDAEPSAEKTQKTQPEIVSVLKTHTEKILTGLLVALSLATYVYSTAKIQSTPVMENQLYYTTKDITPAIPETSPFRIDIKDREVIFTPDLPPMSQSKFEESTTVTKHISNTIYSLYRHKSLQKDSLIMSGASGLLLLILLLKDRQLRKKAESGAKI